LIERSNNRTKLDDALILNWFWNRSYNGFMDHFLLKFHGDIEHLLEL